jgi:hypothetical protein
MKNALLFVVLCFQLAACKAQSQQIVYDLPQSVTTLAKAYIDGHGPGKKFYAFFDEEPEGRFGLAVLEYPHKWDSADSVLIKNTSRVVRIGGLLLPIVIGTDYLFADFGARPPRTKGGKVGKVKVVFTYDAPTIVFDSNGNIYSK